MLAYLVLTVLCAVVLVKRPGRASKVYFTLFFAALFRAVGSVVVAFNMLIPWDDTYFSEPNNLHIVFALSSIPDLLNNWSLALLFLSTCLLIRDRQLLLHSYGVSAIAPLAYYIIFALLAIFATASAGYTAGYREYIYTASSAGNEIPEETWKRMSTISYRLSTVTSSLVHISSVSAAGYILYTRYILGRAGVGDKVKCPSTLWF